MPVGAERVATVPASSPGMGPVGPDLSIVIVGYQSRHVIGDCLTQLDTACSRHRHELILVDNASTDGTADQVAALRPDATVIRLDRNRGFSAACNIGIARAAGRHVMLLNGDTVPAPGAFDRLVEFLDRTPRAGVVAPVLRNPDGSEQRTARMFPTVSSVAFGRRSPLSRWWPGNRFTARYLGPPTGVAGTRRVDWVSGACLVAPRELAVRLGGLDERYFMYWEDADFCRRLKQVGREVWVVAGAEVMHLQGASSGWNLRQIRRFHISAYRYVAAHHLHGVTALLRPVAALLLAVRAVVELLGSGAAARGRATSVPAGDSAEMLGTRTTGGSGVAVAVQGGEPDGR